MTQRIALTGAPGSPYTRKMLAVLRYRRIPYRLLLPANPALADLPTAKVSLLPTFFLPNERGEIEAVVDSTPLIRRLEADFEGRSILPADPAIAFLDELLEDYADEWLTKPMFHYRWSYAADIAKAGATLPAWRGFSIPDEVLAASATQMVGHRTPEFARLFAETLKAVGRILLTRGAVLHHFGSKEEILREVIGPFLADVDALLDGTDLAKPMSAHRRRRFLTGFVDLLCDNRSVSSLLTRDITAQAHLGPTMRLADRVERFCCILAGPEPTAIQRLRTLIAIGGIVRPLAAPPQVVSLNTPEQRRVMVDCAITSLRS